MVRLKFTPAARDDLRQIRQFIARKNPVRAKSFIVEIRDHCRRLADGPILLAIDDDIDPNAHRAVHGAYLIFYDSSDNGILVLRVLHGAQKLVSIDLRAK